LPAKIFFQDSYICEEPGFPSINKNLPTLVAIMKYYSYYIRTHAVMTTDAAMDNAFTSEKSRNQSENTEKHLCRILLRKFLVVTDIRLIVNHLHTSNHLQTSQ